jgi:methionyl-tRNA synthetase
MADTSTTATQKQTIAYDQFAKLDLRVATVVAAREHPNAEKLLLLQIRLGDQENPHGEKQIVAGIRGHYQPQDLVGRQIIVLNNLEPAMLRGEESQGMLLAASDASGVILLRPDRACQSGAVVK